MGEMKLAIARERVNGLAERYSQDGVRQARSYLKSIFDEAIEQEFLVKDPTRKLKIPKNLRPKDKRILSWDQLCSILAETARGDRLLLTLDMTEALRPSELFALRWRSFDNHNILAITETVYRRNIRPFGKTPGSLTKVHLPDGLASELWRWKLECNNSSPDAFIFPNADGGFMDTDNYRFRVLKPLAERLGIEKLNFQILRRTMAAQAQGMGFDQGHPGAPAARQGPIFWPTNICRRCQKACGKWSDLCTQCSRKEGGEIVF
jgi:integrase